MGNRSAQFRLISIRRPTRYVAARQAVLTPILGRWIDDRPDNGSGLWYRRVRELRHAGLGRDRHPTRALGL